MADAQIQETRAQATRQQIPIEQEAAVASDWKVATQHSGAYLFESKQGVHLRPDITLKNKDSVVVLDTKWKMLSKATPADSDQYQMFAYGNRLDASNVRLVYPALEEAQASKWLASTGDYDVATSFINLQAPESARRSVEQLLLECITRDDTVY